MQLAFSHSLGTELWQPTEMTVSKWAVWLAGPTFRAEKSNTSRHLAEFWMIEPEMAFADLAADMDCAEVRCPPHWL